MREKENRRLCAAIENRLSLLRGYTQSSAKMNPAPVDLRLWRSAIKAGCVSVALVFAAIIPIGMLIAPLSIPASIMSFVYAIRSYRRKEMHRSRAIIGVILALFAPSLVVGVLVLG